ncbi:hypothetical protein CERSUDRAFT_112939 [Gelatoporia subvermispora B]|uniref:ZZ-type domain-containing protein n=1 Tax=Ceriporiopsis subvermispora (strain B) TaxID=914234 RepID=M2RKC9_CERS8|nr:hypothetical protein CERSUDRAFT_112939 [Gelatoporia subvermispora B]
MPSSIYSQDYAGTDARPDKPLVVKCTYEQQNKRITFSSTRICNYELLRQRIERCFSLSATPYTIDYTDDDGEVTDITTDDDLTEAIRYFYSAGDDAPISSGASILSGRSIGRSKITVRVRVSIPYDGPSLSDTSSIISLEEYRRNNGSQASLSLSAPSIQDLDDDAITVSSKDMGSRYDTFRSRGPRTIVTGSSREHTRLRTSPREEDEFGAETSLNASRSQFHDATNGVERDPFADRSSNGSRYLEEPSGPFERLKLEDELRSLSESMTGSLSNFPSSLHTDRWLREQNDRAVKSILGDLPAASEPSEISDGADESSSVVGELALQQDPRGKFYYAYTGSSRESTFDDASYDADISSAAPDSRPVSMDFAWANAQQADLVPVPSLAPAPARDELRPQRPSSSSSNPFKQRSQSEPMVSADYIHPDIPPEVLSFVAMSTASPSPPRNPSLCSNCSVILDVIRYVCSTCGERKPLSPSDTESDFLNVKGKSKAIAIDRRNGYMYPPTLVGSGSPSMSAWSVVTGSETPLRTPDDSTYELINKPLPASPDSATLSSGPSSLASRPNGTYRRKESGFELCSDCVQSPAGVVHALEMSQAPGSSPDLSFSAADAQRMLSEWRRSAPRQKGQLRHAYIEQSWGHDGWQDVEQDDRHTIMCSTCSTVVGQHRYKCASCDNFNLCRACYSQVHEVHPSHAFLFAPHKTMRTLSEPVLSVPALQLPTDDRSLVHAGVKCAHCMQDIVGALFHCAICDSVDICSNCESAGLPGNLDSDDNGHNSSHILIKIPYPLGTTELQALSRSAKHLWIGRDAATVLQASSASRRNSLTSSYSYTRTVLGIGSRLDSTHSLDTISISPETDDHGVRCDACSQPIVGVRYQCASCPSLPKAFSLCARCEERSYVVHDPMHIFFKLPRPVHRPLQSEYPMLTRLYIDPVGPPEGAYDPLHPRDYLTGVYHARAVCDRCMSRIGGIWFHCAYCPRDLCEICEELDEHDKTHVFIMFKSTVDMQLFRSFDLDYSQGSQTVIQDPIYLH